MQVGRIIILTDDEPRYDDLGCRCVDADFVTRLEALLNASRETTLVLSRPPFLQKTDVLFERLFKQGPRGLFERTGADRTARLELERWFAQEVYPYMRLVLPEANTAGSFVPYQPLLSLTVLEHYLIRLSEAYHNRLARKLGLNWLAEVPVQLDFGTGELCWSEKSRGLSVSHARRLLVSGSVVTNFEHHSGLLDDHNALPDAILLPPDDLSVGDFVHTQFPHALGVCCHYNDPPA